MNIQSANQLREAAIWIQNHSLRPRDHAIADALHAVSNRHYFRALKRGEAGPRSYSDHAQRRAESGYAQ